MRDRPRTDLADGRYHDDRRARSRTTDSPSRATGAVLRAFEREVPCLPGAERLGAAGSAQEGCWGFKKAVYRSGGSDHRLTPRGRRQTLEKGGGLARGCRVGAMSDLNPRRSPPPSRRQREQRAYQLVAVGGVAGTVAVVGAVLAIAGIVGSGVPILALVVAALCGLLFRRTVSG
jgi:hypothetical protein